MKICDATMKDLWLGRKVQVLNEVEAVIVGLNMERPPTCTAADPNTTSQTGPRYSTFDLYIIYSRRLILGIYIESSELQLLDETLTTKDLYDILRD